MCKILSCVVAFALLPCAGHAEDMPPAVDASTLQHKVMCGYQGWFNCPGDGAHLGWSSHWSKKADQLTPATVNVEYWPDTSELGPTERFPAPGFTYPDGRQAELFSSHNAETILRHFKWMQQYGIEGVWLQRFVVGLKGGPLPQDYPGFLDVFHDVRNAVNKTGRVWAIAYDASAMPPDQLYDVLVADWKSLVDKEHLLSDPRYVHEGGIPVVEIFGFYSGDNHNKMTPAVANHLLDFFDGPGPYHALVVGSGDWNWRSNPDPEWKKVYRRFKAYVPWNIGNYHRDQNGISHAAINSWKGDRDDCQSRGALWIPTVYPGFSWNNLRNQPWGTTTIPRRKGNFLWEQFHALSQMGGIDTIYLAMFDEVDEGTAIFKVASAPPTQAHFLTYEGMPSDWYMRLVGKGEALLRAGRPVPETIPIQP